MAFHRPCSRRLMSTSTDGRAGEGPITRMVRPPPCHSVTNASPDQRRGARGAQIVDLLDRRQLAQHQLRRRLAQRPPTAPRPG